MSDSAVLTLVSGIITITTVVIGFLTLWIKLKYGVEKAEETANKAADKAKVVERKIDDNTALTKQASAKAEAKAESTIDVINRKLNGGIDDAIKSEIGPIRSMLESHITQDANDLTEVKSKMDGIAKHSNEHSHNIRQEMHNLTLKIDLVLKKIDGGAK